MAFKNALCLESQPDYYSYPGWHHRCHRHKNHKGEHRICFPDGYCRVWKTGDKESRRFKTYRS